MQDTSFIRKHRLQSIRSKHKNLRAYHGRNKIDKSWHVGERFEFNPNGSVKFYRSGNQGFDQYVPSDNIIKHIETRDSLGRLRRDIAVWHDTMVFDDAYEYDEAGRLQRVMRTEPGSAVPVLFQTYVYDAQGHETECRTYACKSTYSPGRLIKHYDKEGRLHVSVFRSEPFKELDSLYYDTKGRVVKGVHYQMSGQLLYSTGRTLTEYDEYGRRTRVETQGYPYDQKDATSTWTYNSNGNVTHYLEHQYDKVRTRSFTPPEFWYNSFKKIVCRYDGRGIEVESKEYDGQFITSPTDIKEKDLVEIHRWKPKYFR